jgi:hypothetical protein
VEGGAAEGPGPAQQGWGLPSPPRSQQQPWLHGPPAPGPNGPPHGGDWRLLGAPAHGGHAGQGSPEEVAVEAWGSVCAPVCVCVCVCVRARVHCSTGRLHVKSGGTGVGGALKGHQSPRASARTQKRLLGGGREATTPL